MPDLPSVDKSDRTEIWPLQEKGVTLPGYASINTETGEKEIDRGETSYLCMKHASLSRGRSEVIVEILRVPHVRAPLPLEARRLLLEKHECPTTASGWEFIRADLLAQGRSLVAMRHPAPRP